MKSGTAGKAGPPDRNASGPECPRRRGGWRGGRPAGEDCAEGVAGMGSAKGSGKSKSRERDESVSREENGSASSESRGGRSCDMGGDHAIVRFRSMGWSVVAPVKSWSVSDI
jgi:hypothetical protein